MEQWRGMAALEWSIKILCRRLNCTTCTVATIRSERLRDEDGWKSQRRCSTRCRPKRETRSISHVWASSRRKERRRRCIHKRNQLKNSGRWIKQCWSGGKVKRGMMKQIRIKKTQECRLTKLLRKQDHLGVLFLQIQKKHSGSERSGTRGADEDLSRDQAQAGSANETDQWTWCTYGRNECVAKIRALMADDDDDEEK